MLPLDFYLDIVASGVLTGLVYGLMALGLSVIFGVVRVVNFAHGELTVASMYLGCPLASPPGSVPLLLPPFSAPGLLASVVELHRPLLEPFIGRPEHAQFML